MFGNNYFNSNTFGMNSGSLESFQGRIVGPSEIVPYANIVETAYPPYAISSEPFVGLKLFLRDSLANRGTPADRVRYLETVEYPDPYGRKDTNGRPLPSGVRVLHKIFEGTGAIIRETDNHKMIDGYWLITMPVPKSQLAQQLNNLGFVLTKLENEFGIVYQDVCDINISGRCPLIDTERALSQVSIPSAYKDYLMTSDNSPYKLGYIQRINDEYMILRTRWCLPRNNMFEHVNMITTSMQTIFRYR